MDEHERGRDLVARAVAGDRPALEELLLTHYDRLAAQITRKLPADLAGVLGTEDILQETFLETAQRIHTFEPRDEQSFYSWISIIAEHRLIDVIRARRAAKRGGARVAVDAGNADWSRSLTNLLSLVAVHERTPSRSAAGREAVAAVEAALSRIKPEYGEALRFRYIEGLSVAETAARMGRTMPGVHMLCHRGLQQLREVLGPESSFLSRKE